MFTFGLKVALSQKLNDVNARSQKRHLNLNLKTLLMKRQIDNPSPGTVTWRKLVVNLDTLLSDSSEEEIRELFPVPDSLWEEAIPKDIFTSRGYY